MDDLIADFLADTRVDLERVQNALARLNQGASLSETFDDIYQGIRALRAASGKLGLVRTADLTTSVEEMLERLKQGAPARPETIQALTRAVDRIGRLMALLSASGAEPAGGDPDVRAALADDDGEARARQARLNAFQRPAAAANANIWGAVEAAVNAVSAHMNKHFVLEIEPSARELPVTLLQPLQGALTRVARYACMHGLEPEAIRLAKGKRGSGSLRITSLTVEGEVVIAIADDGPGLDFARLRRRGSALNHIRADQPLTDAEAAELIFAPGVSSFGEGERSLSALDKAREELSRAGARIEVNSIAGRGATFLIRTPLAAATPQRAARGQA